MIYTILNWRNFDCCRFWPPSPRKVGATDESVRGPAEWKKFKKQIITEYLLWFMKDLMKIKNQSLLHFKYIS